MHLITNFLLVHHKRLVKLLVVLQPQPQSPHLSTNFESYFESGSDFRSEFEQGFDFNSDNESGSRSYNSNSKFRVTFLAHSLLCGTNALEAENQVSEIGIATALNFKSNGILIRD